jgi:hypothetical protein
VGNGEEKDRGSGENPEGRDEEGDTECLGGPDAGREEGRGSGADLRRGAGRTDRSAAAAAPAQRKRSASGDE